MIRKQLYAMQYNPNRETAIQFWDRFEDLVRNYDTIPNSAPLSHDEKRDAFYNAIVLNVPDVKSVEFITKNQTGQSLSYDALEDIYHSN